MYLRFFRRLRIAPGVTVNLSKSGPSLSVGVRGAHVTVGRDGVRETVGVPGTGLFLTHQEPYHRAAPHELPFGGPPSGWLEMTQAEKEAWVAARLTGSANSNWPSDPPRRSRDPATIAGWIFIAVTAFALATWFSGGWTQIFG